ncbi:ExeM/NucH family extracellular endonuclease [Poseidonocella sp. HB161398]|uniref:ExeM/NucH family extracellular endonuclease n=1 Tax=Poseidonocella sp. HB161398 TaxID=2320855 RepID=UPI0011096288|nr:ExeM/NucH family extracellular endonuclease [Poseidonocella sp. HB161398]
MTAIFSEGFETDGNGTRYTTSTAEFTDGSGDFFLRTDGSDIGAFMEYSGAEGSYFFAASDIDGEDAAATQRLDFTGIDISGYADLSLSALLAEDDDGSNEDWDAADSFTIEYRIDGGAWMTAIAIANDGSTYNTAPRRDADLDGIGEGQELSPVFAAFAADLAGTGSAMDIRVTFTLDSGDEDIALDLLEVVGTAAAGAYALSVTEIWSGQQGDDVTADWFEIANTGTASWVQGVDPDLFYDDDSADPAAADLIEGIASLAPGETAVVVVGTSADAVAFEEIWEEVIDLDGVQIGHADGAGLGSGGDTVTIFEETGTQGDDTLQAGVIIESQAYGETEANSGQSWNTVTGSFSEAGSDGAVATLVTAGDDGLEPAIGSPGNGAAVGTGGPGEPVPPSDAPSIFSYGQDFDSETTTGGIYTDQGDAAADHDLANNPGEAPVNSEVSGLAANGQLAFTASYINTRGDEGLTDGDFVGVASFAGEVGSYTSGAQGYEMQDTDGAMVLTFETVDTSAAGAVLVSLDLFVQETGWEEDDLIRIGVDTDGDGEVDVMLLDTAGLDIDDLGLENGWTTLSATVPAEAAEATLMVYLDSNSSSESIYIDSVKIGTAPLTEFRFTQSFENETASAHLYFDEGDANADHALANDADADRRRVNSEASSAALTGELAYSARFEDTRPSQDGMTDGAPTGVSLNTGFTGGMSDGANGYQFKDTDGNFVLEFERIENIASDLVTVSLDVFVNETDWEARDRIAIGVDTDGDGEIDQYLVDSTGQLVDDVIAEGQWVTLSTQVVAPESIQLIVEHDANWTAESMMIDNVVIEGQTGVAGIPAAPAPEAQNGLGHRLASVTEIVGGAEIVAKIKGHDAVVVANGDGLSFFNADDIGNPVAFYQLDPTVLGSDASAVTSVAATGEGATAAVAFAVPDATVTDAGMVYFGNYVDGRYHGVEVGALPDMVAFSEDGNYLLVANEGQSADGDNAPGVLPNPDGSVSIIALERDGSGLLTGNSEIRTFDFSDPSITAEALAAKGIRIDPDAPSVAADIEPEFIAVTGNSAYISLQENNAVAIIEDIASFTGFTIDDIVTAGEIDHLQLGFGLDTSDRDSGAEIKTADVTGLAMPDGLVAFDIGGTTYFAGASEGDTRGTDEARAKDADVDPAAYSAADLADDNLGRLTVSTIDGDTDGDGDIDQLTAFGTRSVAIYDADGNRLFDSGDLLARIVLAEQGEERYPDGRSDNKGVEPEYVEFGEIGGTPYLFVGLERAQSVVVFDLTDPGNPVYDSVIDLPEVDEPEGLEFVSAADSPSGQPLLLVAGEANSTLAIVELESNTPDVTIGAVQGTGSESAMTGAQVALTGVVVGDYDDEGELAGFYIQSAAADADGDAATSDGIFVYVGDATGDLANVSEGDLVRVTGTVDEYFGQTQIDTVTGLEILAGDQLGQVEAAHLSLPSEGSYLSEETYEAVEGMLVTIDSTLYVSEYYQLARYGQITLTEGGRPYTYTQVSEPSVEGYEAWLEELGSLQIILDDANNAQNAYTGDTDVIPLPDGGLSVDNYFRGGDSVTGLTGVMSWSWAGSSGTDAWRLRPTEEAPVTFDKTNPREETPGDVGGSLKVASFNVLNYFTTLDDGSASVNGDPRGASSQAELDQQTEKLVAAMLGMEADVFGLVEIENEFGDQNGDGRFAVEYLTDALNAAAGAEIYAWVDPGQGTVDSTDVITGAFIYDQTTVEVTEGSTVGILNDSTNPLAFGNAVFDGSSTNRASLAVSFTELATEESFTAVMNHFKSKGTVNPAEGNADAGDGAGANNAIRLQAAQSLDAWLATDPTGSGDTRVLAMGDLNAYAMEDPITWLEAAGYADLARTFEGEDAYSYVFDSQLGTLDYALANEDLFDFVTGATEWHINADEVPLFDYNDDVLDSGESAYEEEPGGSDLFSADPYRTSDHDPVLVGLDLTADTLL